jgi:hypothetical protein
MFEKIRIWPKTTSILNNESGAVIIAALMVLVLLTIIGIASTNVSNTEVKIATHELIHQQNFYCAEGTTAFALEEMEKSGNPKSLDWMWTRIDPETGLSDFSVNQVFDSTLWDGTMTDADATPETVDSGIFSDSADILDPGYFANYRGLLPKEPLEIGVTKRYRFDIYGRCAQRNRGSVAIEVGYVKAF